MRKLSYFLLSCFALAIFITSCHKDSNNVSDNYDEFIGYTPKLHRIILSGQYGYIDNKGTTKIVPQFDYGDDFWFDMAVVEQYDESTSAYKYGFINTSGDLVVPYTYNDAFGFTKEGLSVVKNDDGYYGYINKEGKIVIACQYNYAEDFNEGLACFENSNYKYGFINTSGNIVIPASYDYSDIFTEGYAYVVDDNKKVGFIDKTGRLSIDYKFDDAYPFINDYACVEIDSMWGYIATNGNFKIAPTYKNAYPFWEDLACIEVNGKYGFINTSGNIVINPQYDDAGDFSEGMAYIKSNGLYGFINNEGKIVILCQYKDIYSYFSDGIALVEISDGVLAYIDKNAKIIWQGEVNTSKAAIIKATIKNKKSRKQMIIDRILSK